MSVKIKSDDDAVSLRFEITAILREEIGFHEKYAAQLAEPIVNGLRKRYQGETLYVPKTDNIDIDKRNEGIRQEFTGTKESLDKVMAKYQVSKTTVYRVCNMSNPPKK